MNDKLFVKGSEAIAEAAVRAGCRFFAGYPITPQNELPEYMSWRLPEVGGTYVQGESEMASMNMIFGAASTGTRCMTSSSGPGLSLKAESLSCALGSKLPHVMAIMMRGGPGHGIIFPAQQDYEFAVHGPCHGGVKQFILAPSTAQEAVDLTYSSFDIADKYRTGVLILGDGFLANTIENVTFPPMKKLEDLPQHKDWKITEYDPNHHKLITSYFPPEIMEQENIKMGQMYEYWEEHETQYQNYLMDDCEILICAYGSTGRICEEVVDELRNEGLKVGLFRPITLHPFPKKVFEEIDYNRVKLIVSVEMAIPGQLVEDIKNYVARRTRVEHFGRSGGVLINPGEIKEAIHKMVEE
ncbi:MAG: 3-methyl-2-oxobutanoate dehydrogenase subunit VorB [Eubacteriaceae bacterium]|jgi:2-oxoglutarate ferredoxin oxidoreductase subunit alpha|nr:3-methyl-2-oxobutanoate dehydrogenase subunit VorB [Eubacteriaceae bacterium]